MSQRTTPLGQDIHFQHMHTFNRNRSMKAVSQTSRPCRRRTYSFMNGFVLQWGPQRRECRTEPVTPTKKEHMLIILAFWSPEAPLTKLLRNLLSHWEDACRCKRPFPPDLGHLRCSRLKRQKRWRKKTINRSTQRSRVGQAADDYYRSGSVAIWGMQEERSC